MSRQKAGKFNNNIQAFQVFSEYYRRVFDADVMQLAMMLQEMKNEDVRRAAIAQVRALTKLGAGC